MIKDRKLDLYLDYCSVTVWWCSWRQLFAVLSTKHSWTLARVAVSRILIAGLSTGRYRNIHTQTWRCCVFMRGYGAKGFMRSGHRVEETAQPLERDPQIYPFVGKYTTRKFYLSHVSIAVWLSLLICTLQNQLLYHLWSKLSKRKRQCLI